MVINYLQVQDYVDILLYTIQRSTLVNHLELIIFFKLDGIIIEGCLYKHLKISGKI